MPFLVNQTFFVQKLYIPNLTNGADLARLNEFIARYEPNCLLSILGYPLYKLFGTESSQRMDDLLNGAEFTNRYGEIEKWKGLVYDVNKSLIAAYIYFYFQEWNASHSTGTGNSISLAEAGIVETPAHKMAQAWNMFSEDVEQMASFLRYSKDIADVDIYPEFDYRQYYKTLELSRRIDSIFSL